MCSTCSSNLGIDLSFIKFIKLINTYTHSERKNQAELIEEFWKFQFNKANLGSAFLVWKYVCMIFMMYEILLWQLKLVSTIFAIHYYFCYENKTFKKLSKMLFVLPKISFWPRDYQIFVFHCFSLFSFLDYCCFYRRSWLMISSKFYDIFMSLICILKTQVI